MFWFFGSDDRTRNPIAAISAVRTAGRWLRLAKNWVPAGSKLSEDVQDLDWRLELLERDLEQEVLAMCGELLDQAPESASLPHSSEGTEDE